MYRGRSREDTKPHIYAVADEAFRNLVEEGQNQSILVTGESGAGKTENTKKVIQYLAAVATSDTPRAAKSGTKHLSNLSEQILRANPILEAFGNAQTVRNNNSSRFGKFIRIEFTRSGQIAGAYIDWYLLEKSRVVKLNSSERTYHVFYQLLRGADTKMKKEFGLTGLDIENFQYTSQGNDAISGISDFDEWNSLIEAFHIMGFSEKEQASILKTVACVLHLGNISVMKESLRADQAAFDSDATKQARLVAQLLGVPAEPFINGLLHPRVKAGREWVEKVQTPEQVRLSIDALAKGIYERQFGDLVDRINRQLNRTSGTADDTNFIGVLDIAGFEIFEENSFEQLCINYTNEKLQQFFNHHMFVLEQEEYAREQIEWKFIDFGKDLQPTIDLIELSNPIGIFSCLDEDSVMPKATDITFTDKLHQLWDRKTPKYRRSLRQHGFILTHYAAEVEYSTTGWLEKNKDPLNDNVTRLLASSSDKHLAHLFADCTDTEDEPGSTRSRVKKGLFRTVAQRHKEQLSTLMGQLHSTHPHFVRCIIPNHRKKAKQFNAPLVLDQLRCNGVLEGIRIARTGFPNRLTFNEFRSRYEVLCNEMPKTYLEGQVAVKLMLEKLNMDKAFYRVGLTKVFFRAGVLADLEERRDTLISDIVTRFQSVARGFVQRRTANKRLYRAEATRIIQRNMAIYLDMQANPWWRLFVRMKPLLGATRQAAEVKKRDETIQKLQDKAAADAAERQRIDEERRRTEQEVQRVTHTLESERALALDKEEIFKRLQDRESQLRDELATALEDQDKLEEELDAVMEVQKTAEQEVQTWRLEVEKASTVIARLESDKKDLIDQLADLEDQLHDLENVKAQRSEQEESLSQEVKMLESHLALKDRKLQDMETRILKSSQDLDVKLAETTKELTASKKQVRDLQDENKHVRQQLTQLSGASSNFEELIRQKSSELALLKSESRKFDSDRQAFESEKRSLTSKHDTIQSKLRDMKAEFDTLSVSKAQAERDAMDAKKLLEQRITDDEGRKLLEKQVNDLRQQLAQVQTDMTRERQSRDDVQMLGEHKFSELKRNFDTLNESKITIEKELYAQQDILRRATESKAAAESDRKDLQTELRTLREKFLSLQESKLQAETTVENRVMKVSNERQAAMRRDIEHRDQQILQLEDDNAKLSQEVQELTQEMADSGMYKSQEDQEKQRLEREVVTLRGRLSASENDNRALLNKVQQKNLDIARSNSRAGEASRGRISQLTNEKSKFEEENKKLQKRLEDAQTSISSLEKQKEKLSLELEDLTHEVDREHKSSRNAEKLTSNVNLQLAEANRKLESERQLRTQAQTNTRTVQSSLDQANKELDEARNQLMVFRKVFDPNTPNLSASYEASKPDIARKVDLAQQLDASQQAVRVANDKCSRLESQLQSLRNRHGDEMAEIDARHADSKRVLLEEMSSPQVNSRNSPMTFRGFSENKRPYSPTQAMVTTPRNQRQLADSTPNNSARSDRTVDTVTYRDQMDMVSEMELLQNQLAMSEVRNKHLQSMLEHDRPIAKSWNPEEDSPSFRRIQKLERENSRLNDKLDDSSKKVSALEHSLRSGQLTLKEVQTKSHEELYELISSQQQDRNSLNRAYNGALTELTDAKTAFDEIKQTKAQVEFELRKAKAEAADLSSERDQDNGSHSQLLQEFSDLQMRLDSETSKLDDVTATLDMYKARANDYFNRLEQAELAVLKASRAEEFAKKQSREADDVCATVMSERKTLESAIEDLQRQNQTYEARIEDLAADLDGALQSKRRMQNELEDYRSQRAIDIEDKETGFDQARRKYTAELKALSAELENERQNVIAERETNSSLRDEIEDLRGKWDDEVINSSAWSKEKMRIEIQVQEMSVSRDEAVQAHAEAQNRIVTLVGQIHDLRNNNMTAESERDSLAKEKRVLETRLADTMARLDDLVSTKNASNGALQSAAAIAVNKEVQRLKAELDQQLDISDAALVKMKRADISAQEAQSELVAQRDANVQMHKEKAALEKSAKEMHIRLVELETKGFSSVSGDVRFLHGRIQEVRLHILTSTIY
jgi:myosin heavy chain 9/10/11/14